MDGRGRCQDNIFVERLWWTIKHQYLYLHALDGGASLRKGLTWWISYYNHGRSHTTLDDRTPDEVYYDLPLPYAPLVSHETHNTSKHFHVTPPWGVD